MRKAEFQFFKNHILDFFDGDFEQLKKQVKIYHQEKSYYRIGLKLAGSGFFDVYYVQCEKTLKKLYGEKYNENIYKTKKGDFRIKNGEIYIWTVYQNKIAKAIEKMMEDVE